MNRNTIHPQGRREGLDRGSRSGQALAEMVVGMVSILVLVAGLLQIGVLSREHTKTLLDARAEADMQAMSPIHAEQLMGAGYIQDWEEGVEGVRYTRKDRPSPGDPQGIISNVVDHALPSALYRTVGEQRVHRLDESLMVTDAFEFVRGHSYGDPVEMLPIMRRLVTTSESLRMEHEVWMPWTRGLDR